MAETLSKNTATVTDLKNKTREIIQRVHHTQKPLTVTVNGKPDVVLLAAEVFERKLKVLNLKRMLAQADRAIQEGRTRPAGEFLKDLKKRAKIHR